MKTYNNNFREKLLALGEDKINTMMQKELANYLGCNVTTVQYLLKELKIIKTKIYQEPEIILTEQQNSVIIGNLLGDGSIGKYKFDDNAQTNQNSVFRFSHAEKQKAYANYKADLLGDLVTSRRFITNMRYDVSYPAFLVTCKRNKVFSKLRDKWYPNDKRTVPSDIELTRLTLAIWYQDNGSINSSSTQIAAQSLTIGELELVRSKLYNMGISTTVWSSGDIYIIKDSQNTFDAIVRPFIHDSMLYKLHRSE